ncbi:22785_t:CDS:2 [Rhizophagus irregularis]|nr:22785_t:CDS:2 [Rhizophagus irregularis]
MLPVSPHMHSNYGGFNPHFGPTGGYPPHAIRYHPDAYSPTTYPASPSNTAYKSHDSHQPPQLMSQHGQLMPTTSLPPVSPVSGSSTQPDLSPVNSPLGNNGGNGYHMTHHIQHQTNTTPSTTYHNPEQAQQAQQSQQSQQSPNQEASNYSSTVTPVSMPSPPESIPPHQSSNLRFEILLESPTASAQRIDETPITYLNKGQYYAIGLQDHDKYDAEFTTVIKVMFHDDAHRKMASTYWGFWLTQQASPKNARAVDIDKAASTGISNLETKIFDRVQFQWNGKKGAKIFGAERKNKDDQKHLEKMCEKMRAKSQETTPMIMMYAPPNPVTVFNECTRNNNVSDDEEILNLSETLNNLDPDVEGSELMTLQLGKRKRFSMGSDLLEPLDCDPTYIPHLRKRLLCIYVKLPGEAVYKAVYLNHLTVQDLIAKLTDKLSEKIDLQGQPITNVIRCTKRNLTVRIDDDSIHQIEDETDMEVEFQIGQDGNVQLTLKY